MESFEANGAFATNASCKDWMPLLQALELDPRKMGDEVCLASCGQAAADWMKRVFKDLNLDIVDMINDEDLNLDMIDEEGGEENAVGRTPATVAPLFAASAPKGRLKGSVVLEKIQLLNVVADIRAGDLKLGATPNGKSRWRGACACADLEHVLSHLDSFCCCFLTCACKLSGTPKGPQR